MRRAPRHRTTRHRAEEQASALPWASRGPDAGSAMGNRALAQWLAREGAAGLEVEAERAAAAVVPGLPAGPQPAGVANAAGQPLDRGTRRAFEAAFGQDFSGVRIHDDAGTQQHLHGAHAHALTVGEHIGFARGAYRPDTAPGRHRLAHELAHVVQQRGGAPGAGGRPALSRAAVGPQADANRDALTARLKAVKERLAVLRAKYQALNDEFHGSMMKDRLDESLKKGTADLNAKIRTDSAANALWGGTRAAQQINNAVSFTQSGNTVDITARMQLRYTALTDKKGREKAATDIPRMTAAVRDVWQVKITRGDYAGIDFRLVPSITYRGPKEARAKDAFAIDVRAPDGDPSQGDSVHGVISLAPAHLEGARVVVVAHELAHLFGFVDQYLTMTIPGKKGRPATEQWSVGRQDPAGRADLLGMIDPVVLKRLHKKGAVLDTEMKRQSGTVRIWEEDASIVLKTLGIAPPKKPPPTIDDEDFDPADDLERLRREGEGKLADIRRKRRRADNAIESLDVAEEIMKLEAEEKDLDKQLGNAP